MTDDSGSIREAVICGAGIAYLLHVTVAKDLAEGRLVELLPDLRFPTMPVFAVHAFGRQLPVRGKLFIDSLAERMCGGVGRTRISILGMFSGTAFSPPVVGAMRRIVAHVAPAPGRRHDPTISPYASCCSSARPFPSG